LGYADLFGIVSQVGASAIPEKFVKEGGAGRRWMTIQLIGEGTPQGHFSRGISQYPTVGDSVHIVSHDDLKRIYGRPDSPRYVPIGQIASSESIPALLDINYLVTRHSAIVGSTGSGKSTAVSSILNSIAGVGRFQSARVLLIDMHGEYSSALGDRATVFRINPNIALGEQPFFIPYWALEFDELLNVSFGMISTDADRGGILEKIRQLKLESIIKTKRKGVTEASLNVDTPVPFSIHRLWHELHLLVSSTHLQTGNQNIGTVAFAKDSKGNIIDKGDPLSVRPPVCLPQDTSAGATPKVYLSQSPLNIRRPLEALSYRLRDKRYDFLFRPGNWLPDEKGDVINDLDVLLDSWLECKRPVTILDLSGVPREILHTLIGALLRIIYDSLFWARSMSEGGRERPLLLVLEEAHAYLYKDSNNSASRMVKKIVREGRKYGIGALIVSQRPSEIDSTILSQCGTLFALRLTNSQDRAHISSAAPDNLEGLFSLLPILRTGEAIIVGEAVHIPTRVIIEAPPEGRRPLSEDPLVFESKLPGGWNRPREPSNYSDVVEVWRKQDSRSPRLKDLDTEKGKEK
jgi:hypothetical protein